MSLTRCLLAALCERVEELAIGRRNGKAVGEGDESACGTQSTREPGRDFDSMGSDSMGRPATNGAGSPGDWATDRTGNEEARDARPEIGGGSKKVVQFRSSVITWRLSTMTVL